MYYCANCKKKLSTDEIKIAKNTTVPRCPYCNRFLPRHQLSEKNIERMIKKLENARDVMKKFLKKMRYFQYSRKDLAKFTDLPIDGINNVISDLLKEDLVTMEKRNEKKYYRWRK